LLEPGRAVIASAGCLVVKILYKKSTSQKNFLVVDGGMNDFIRPALYGAYHLITPLIETETVDKTLYDVVGPVCESGDFLGKDRMLPSHLKEGDYLIIRDCGAYGYSMASQYNLRPLPAEVLLSKKTFKIIRKSGL
jgi:diaminopimelate decarboxylase